MDDKSKETLERGADALDRRDELRAIHNAILVQLEKLTRQAWYHSDVFIDAAMDLADVPLERRGQTLSEEEKQRFLAARAMIEKHLASRKAPASKKS